MTQNTTHLDQIARCMSGERQTSDPAGKGAGAFLVDQLLRQQQSMTAVESFADHHQANESPSQAKYYRALLPANSPGPGQQYAFDVDLDCCSGCKACVTACHSRNGLDRDEAWRDVGLLVGGSSHQPVVQHVTTACHHCLEPACLIACPVNAYEKDAVTGIVKHLDDQCFGCQYCTLACPYEVPSYRPDKGIVRKCDMCSTRLAVGEAPACVQACPNQAIRIQIVDRRQVEEDAEVALFLPAAPDPLITLPPTTYRTRRAFPRNTLPVDYYDVSRQHPHWPLIIMLVMTQLSVGAFVAATVFEAFLPPGLSSVTRAPHALSALMWGVLALAASTFHLGRPQYAYRAVLGLQHSWLSREIACFGAFVGMALVYAACVLVGPDDWSTPVACAVSVAGIAGVFCSAMIYIFTQRECWSVMRTGVRFTLTTALLGVAAIWLTVTAIGLARPSPDVSQLVGEFSPASARWLMMIGAVKLAWEAGVFRHLVGARMTAMKRSALLMTRELSNVTLARFALGGLGAIVMPAFLLQRRLAGFSVIDVPMFVMGIVLVAACVLGELLERYLFFAAVAAPRMPGAIRS